MVAAAYNGEDLWKTHAYTVVAKVGNPRLND